MVGAMKQLKDIKIDHLKLRKARRSSFPTSSLSAVAERLGITRQSLSDYELGRSSPTADRLAQICVLYGISLTDLIDADSLDIKNLREASVNA
jgi:transcriptional regulator with XRE-family HTH domain